MKYLPDLNRRVEVILDAVPEKQLWIFIVPVCERPLISNSRVYFHLAGKRAALALFMADLPDLFVPLGCDEASTNRLIILALSLNRLHEREFHLSSLLDREKIISWLTIWVIKSLY